MNAQGRVDADAIVVDDTAQANRLHSKGNFGEPQSSNSLKLSRTEAAYLVHMGRLDVDVPWTDLLDDEVAYLAYADLRDRGLVVRHHPDGGFLVWQRGQGPKQEPWFRFHARNERDPVRLADLDEGVVGVVDEDGAVTHYLIESARPEGSIMATDLEPVAGTVLADRVLVDGQPFAAEYVGTPHGDQTVLSFTEAESLRRRGLLDVPDLSARATERQLHFEQTLPVYLDLRAHGAVARSGFRFGTHLRAYPRDPDACHAEWLIQCVRPDEAQHWSHVSRAVRLAHGVRKAFLLAGGDPIRYWAISWFRP